MILAEWGALGPGRSELVGTDCRPDAVARAAAGAYDPQAVAAVPQALRERHFMRAGAQFHVCPALRRATAWRTGDVLAAAEPGEWDVVLCRNLSIYLRPEAAAPLWDRLAAALRPGGLLVVGKAERPAGGRGLSPVGPCLYRRGDAE
jgi:chemotaxis methyl-accepting protein methylase